MKVVSIVVSNVHFDRKKNVHKVLKKRFNLQVQKDLIKQPYTSLFL